MSVHLSTNESSPCIFVDILNNQQQNFQQSFGKKAEEKQHLFKLIPIRFIILAISLFCLSLLIANPLALNFTVICMNKEQQLLVISDDELMFSQNSTLNEKDSKEEILEPLFTSDEQSWLFSAIAIGQFIGTIPITKIYIHFGLRKLLFVYGLLSSFSTLLVAPSIYFGGFPALMILRVFQGAGMSSIWVATGAISSTWAPLSNSGIFLAVLTCCFQFGPIISMPLSAEFCSSEMLGWPSVFYLLGIISLILFIIFYWIYRDSPRQFRLLTGRELLLIEKGKNSIQDGRKKCQTKQEIPYISILKDKVFWGVYVCGITSNMAFQALGMEVAKTGVAAALPFVLSAIGKNCAGQISDRLTSISEKSKVIAFASISQYLMGICFLAMALFPKFGIINVTLMQSIFTAATVFSGFNTVGLIKGAQLMSSQFSHVVFYWLTYQLSAIML